MIKHAKQYVKKGLSVIPVGKNKVPLIKWQEFQTRIASEKEIENWWKQYPDAQIGIVTGKISGITVLDEEADALPFGQVNTLRSKTGGGGVHYFFKYKEGLGNMTRINNQLWDIRGDGGFVVVPPSKSEKGEYVWLNNLPMAEFPKDLIKVQENEKPRFWESDFQGVDEGQRDSEMTRYAGHLLAITHPADWQELAWPKFQAANIKNNPPLSDKQLKKIWDSMTARDKRNNADKWKKRTEAALNVLDDERKSEILPIKEAVSQKKLKAGMKIKTGFARIDNALKDIDETEGGLQEGDLIVVGGATGNGKTLFSLNLTHNFAKQGIFTCWFSYEVMLERLYRRMLVMGTDLDMVVAPKNLVQSDLDWIFKKMKEAIERYWVKVFVIDHLFYISDSAKSTLNKNYADYLHAVCQKLALFARNNEVIIILGVHIKGIENRKADLNDLKGSSGIKQEASAVIMLNRHPSSLPNEKWSNKTQISLEKNRFGDSNPVYDIICENLIFRELDGSSFPSQRI